MDAMRIDGMSPTVAMATVRHEVKDESPSVVKQEQQGQEQQAEPVEKSGRAVVAKGKLDADTGIRFSVNLSEDKLQVQIVDRARNEIIRSIPSEEMIKVMDRIDEFIGAYLDLNG